MGNQLAIVSIYDLKEKSFIKTLNVSWIVDVTDMNNQSTLAVADLYSIYIYEYSDLVQLDWFSSSLSITQIKPIDADNIIVATQTGNLSILNIKNRKFTKNFNAHDTIITHIELIRNDLLVTVSYDGLMKAWNITTEVCLATFNPLSRYIITLMQSIGMDRLAVAGEIASVALVQVHVDVSATNLTLIKYVYVPGTMIFALTVNKKNILIIADNLNNLIFYDFTNFRYVDVQNIPLTGGFALKLIQNLGNNK